MTKKDGLRIAGAALNQTPFDWKQNMQNIIQAIERARANDVDILCLPELCITGYGCEDVFLSDWLPEKSLEILFHVAEYCDGIAVSVGLPIRHNGALYNCACFIQNKNILGFTAKQFLANDGVHYEPRWFTAWRANEIAKIIIREKEYPLGDVLYDICGIKLGFEICEDAWRPQRPGIRHCQKGVHLILNPSASHFAFNKSPIRYDLVIGGSERFNCAYVYANLLGNEAGRMIYDGEVLIAYKGKLIQRNNRLSFHDVELVWADVNFITGETSHDPLTHDDREKEYEFWECTCLGLFDYMRKSKSKGFVLSLSGGADSSACAIMVSEMIKKGLRELGLEKFIEKAGIADKVELSVLKTKTESEQALQLTSRLLICAYQATQNSSQKTFESAKELAHSIGATFYSWTIDDEVNSYTRKVEQAIGRTLQWHTDDITLQNIQARSRSPIIWMLANIHNALLITTSNRSEADVGYATMDGDTSGSIAPIAGVDKDFIRKWLLWAEHNLNQKGLRFVNALSPTAELRPAEKSQTDESDLMPYAIMVQIERLAIKQRLSPLQVFEILKVKKLEEENLLKEHIKKFFRLWSRNQWKRERYAPSFHIDDFNVDPRSWCRFPILSGGFEDELSKL
ncbi:MAG: NAD(+) synthase [Cytophagaceae bacterium]|nr:NAD(+) synthase [Cytophagaceae bacterium]MDW8457057.1 NAD(+) synthase [Cytophagaceae bacterium]